MYFIIYSCRTLFWANFTFAHKLLIYQSSKLRVNTDKMNQYSIYPNIKKPLVSHLLGLNGLNIYRMDL